MKKVEKIIIHCTATPEGRNVTVEQIRNWHVKGNGWRDIGYHYVIYLDGSVHAGRAEHVQGAHCPPYNRTSIGVCYVGGYASDCKTPKDTRTKEQKAALVKLVAELRERYPDATVHGHNEFANKHCPCFNVQDEPELCGR